MGSYRVTIDISGEAYDAAEHLSRQFPDETPRVTWDPQTRSAAVRDAVMDVLANDGPDGWAYSIQVEETEPPAPDPVHLVIHTEVETDGLPDVLKALLIESAEGHPIRVGGVQIGVVGGADIGECGHLLLEGIMTHAEALRVPPDFVPIDIADDDGHTYGDPVRYG